MAATLHILAPGLTAPVPGVERLSPPLNQPVLQQFLGRADLYSVPGSDLESTLCHLYGITRDDQGDLPVAALCRAQADGRFWLQAEPVCLLPERSRLLLFDTLDFDVSGAELKALAERFVAYFSAEGWLVEADDPLRWYLSPAEPSVISSFSLGEAFGRSIDMFLPHGPDRLYWHRVLNEVQMLFFDAEVNRQREASGKMPVAGLWFSGFGFLPSVVPTAYQFVFGEDPLSRGLARLTTTPLARVAECRGASLPKSGTGLVVYPHLQRAVWRADSFGWVEKVADFSGWLGQWLDDLRRGRLDALALYPCDGRVFRFTGRHRYRFWKGTRPLSSWLQPRN